MSRGFVTGQRSGDRTGSLMSTKKETAKVKQERAARLSEQLRANLMRRKSQARARREGAADERAEGIELAQAPVRTTEDDEA